MICLIKDDTFKSTSPLVSTPISRAPIIVPTIVPTPPNRLVPPITTEAITVNSSPDPATASAELSRADNKNAARPQKNPLII